MTLVPWCLAIAAACGAESSTVPEPGLRLWPVSPLERVWSDSLPSPTAAAILESEAARGEVLSAQAAVRCDSGFRARLRASELTGPGGATIPAAAVRLSWERRIRLTRNTVATPPEELDRLAPCEVPDPFWEGPELDLSPDRTEGIWIEVTIPRDAAAGAWKGKISVQGDASRAVDLPLEFTIWGFEVPEKRGLDVVQWFTFPGVPFAKSVEPYSERWWALLEKFARIIADHRQNCFLAPYSLIAMRVGKDRRFQGDFARFDRWVETFLRAGAFDRIELEFTARLQGNGLLDPASRILPRRFPVECEDPTMALTDEETLRGYLGALREHLRDRGWLDRAMIHIHDEPFIHHEASYRETAKLVAEAAPGIRRIDAIETEDFFGSLEIWVPKLSHLANWYDTSFRRAHESGAELWFYTCCHPTGRYPNRFLDYPLLKGRVLDWIAYLHDLDGFLHWGLNYFGAEDAYSEEALAAQGLPPGDCAVLYPAADGYLGSLRWSAMRDGLEDFEYLRVLEGRLRALKASYGESARRLDPRQRPVELCRRVAWSFRDYTRDPAVLLETRRTIAKEILAVEEGPLRVLQTSPQEGFPVPGAPRMANVWGIAEAGSRVTIGGEPVPNVLENGVFYQAVFLGDEAKEIVVEVEKGERRARAVRNLPPR